MQAPRRTADRLFRQLADAALGLLLPPELKHNARRVTDVVLKATETIGTFCQHILHSNRFERGVFISAIIQLLSGSSKGVPCHTNSGRTIPHLRTMEKELGIGIQARARESKCETNKQGIN